MNITLIQLQKEWLIWMRGDPEFTLKGKQDNYKHNNYKTLAICNERQE